MKRLLLFNLCCFILFSLPAQTTSEEDNSLFLGTNAGSKDAGDNANTFIGTNSGMYNTTGRENTFIGMDAGEYNNSGSSNAFLGMDAGRYNDLGSYNTFLGHQAGMMNKSGFGNTFVGQAAGEHNTNGGFNTFIGRAAGKHTTSGNANTFLGVAAGYKNTEGFFNTFLGQFAGVTNTVGYSNTFVGLSAGRKNLAGHNNTFIGQDAGKFNSFGNENTFIGLEAGCTNKTGHRNTFIGHQATQLNEGKSLNNAIAIGYQAKVDCDNCAVIGGVEKNKVNVGIGTPAPSFQLQLSTNSAAKPGSSTWTVATDEQLLKEITPFEEGLSLLRSIDPVRYEYNGMAGLPEGTKYVGVLAQEIKEIAPYMVNEFEVRENGMTKNYLDFDANALLYILVNAVKEQQTTIEDQVNSTRILEQEIATLKSRTQEESNQEIDVLKNKVKELTSLVTNLLAERSTSSNQASPSIVLALTEKNKLAQNHPNPFRNYTSINYFIPVTTQQAVLQVTALDGTSVGEVIIQERGKGQVVIEASDFPTGSYYYTLRLDGKVVDSKKMVLVK